MSIKRLMAAGTVVAAALAVPATVLATGSGLSAAQSVKTPAAASPAPEPNARVDLSALASSAGISVGRLHAGLVAAKQAGGNSAAAVTTFEASAGVSGPTAQRVVSRVFGSRVDQSLIGPAAAAGLAARLGVSTTAVQHALEQIGALAGKQGVDPASPAFAAIAHGLGVSPTQLATALAGIKQSLGRG
jgi:hypothetical protein